MKKRIKSSCFVKPVSLEHLLRKEFDKVLKLHFLIIVSKKHGQAISVPNGV
jgi:hypothetical protein